MITSSVMPSTKYSLSGSALRLRNGSTATTGDFGRAVPGAESASANAAAEGNRSAGDFANARTSTWSIPAGTVARRRRTEGIGSTMRLVSTDIAVGPTYGGSPVSSSNNTQARL